MSGELREFTSEELAEYDGRKKPLYVSVMGVVYDCSSSENITPDTGYGKLWAGRDATYSLALGSLNAEDSHVLDFTLKNLEYKHQRSLRLYEKHFQSKYPVVGRLVEYTNQTKDLPTLEELPEKNEPRPVPPTVQRRIKKLTAAEANKVCHAAGFEDLGEDCRLGDLSSAMQDMGREKLEDIAARVDVPFRELAHWDDEILSIEIVERAVEFSGRRNLNPGVEVVLRGLSNTAYNGTRGTVDTYAHERERYAVKLTVRRTHKSCVGGVWSGGVAVTEYVAERVGTRQCSSQ